jgi:hypothetical protein
MTPVSSDLGYVGMNVRLNRLFYTYVYSRDVLETFLARQGLHQRWTGPVGVSQAGSPAR